MENVGCVTYRESALLCKEDEATKDELEGIATTVIHEQAHFWFGDLVTMSWWNGLWLNESFATFMENLCLSFWRPDWQIWDTFGLTRAAALRVDGLKNTHPIEVPVERPDDISEIFDAISYNKGASVLYMLHQFLGYEVFRQGIGLYLKKHALGNTETADLWDALEEASRLSGSNQPVRAIMDAWINLPGHPVVTVDVDEMPGWIKLTQRQFTFADSDNAQEEMLWPIPLVISTKAQDGSVTTTRVLFSTSELKLNIGEGFSTVNVNAGGSGVFRVRYATPLLLGLARNLDEMPVIERFNLLNDAWAFVRAGLSSSVEFIELASKFAAEADPNVFGTLLSALSTLRRLLPEADRAPMNARIRALIEPRLSAIGWEAKAAEPIQTTELRATLFGYMGTIVEDRDAQAKALDLYNQWQADRASVDANIVGAVIDTLAWTGDTARYDEFVLRMREAPTPYERNLFADALTGFREQSLLRRTLDLIFSGEVSIQDSPFLLASLLSNSRSQDMAWEYLSKHWEAVTQAFTTNMLPHVVRACSSLDTEERAALVVAFFNTHKVPAGAMATAQMLEQLSINLRLRRAETARLQQYLQSSDTTPAGDQTTHNTQN